MSEMKNTTINRLPAPTWRWLKMNAAPIEEARFAGGATVRAEVPEGLREDKAPGSLWSVARVSAEEIARKEKELEGSFEPPIVREKDLMSAKDAIYSGAGPEVDTWIEEAGVDAKLYTVPAGCAIDEPLRLHFSGEKDDATADAIRVAAEEGSSLTVIMEYDTAQDAVVQTKLQLAKGACVKLVQIHRVGDDSTFVNDIGAICEEDARLEIIHLILSGKAVYEGCRVDLAGDGSSLKIDTAYLATDNHKLDFNYFANHLGKKTECEINADGVLRGCAQKIFRGTIDFKPGAAGAVGNEKEDVLLMDDTVVNKTIPLILCAEEDVVGNHGATIGRLDEDLLYYLESRGMDRDEVYEMMAQARLDAVIRKVPDAETVNKLFSRDQGM